VASIIDRKSDIAHTSTDDRFTHPLGICDNFKLRIGNVLHSTHVYVGRKASFQLLLGTEFIGKASISLFPRWGAIMLSLPEFQVIQRTCKRISVDKAPPPLSPYSNPAKSVSPKMPNSMTIRQHLQGWSRARDRARLGPTGRAPETFSRSRVGLGRAIPKWSRSRVGLSLRLRSRATWSGRPRWRYSIIRGLDTRLEA
jgi:hypothetical protein